jgi:hypothetical protein
MELMKITGYTDENFQALLRDTSGKVVPSYPLMINPESLKVQRTIEYNSQQIPNTSAPSQKFKNAPSSGISFDIVIDCTGIVDKDRVSMEVEIKKLETIIYTYNGKIHRPNFVKLQWGKTSFNCVLTSFDLQYTLFKPNGNPLRAKISLGFQQYISPTTVEKKDKKQSPDVSHIVTVVKGLSLPQLCQEVWTNDLYYIKVAKFNDLNKFRHLKGGEKLIFPPIIQPV